MNEYRRFIEALMCMITLLFVTLSVAIVLCFTMTGCTSVRYIPVESVKHDSIYISRLERDSIHVHDSIYMEVKTKADTVYQTKYVQKVVYRDALRTDTLLVERIDTIRIPVPVERKLTKWEQGRMAMGGINFTLFLAIIIIGLLWLIKRRV